MVLADHVSLPQRNPQRGLCARQNPKRGPALLALTFSTLLSSQETDAHRRADPFRHPTSGATTPHQLTSSIPSIVSRRHTVRSHCERLRDSHRPGRCQQASRSPRWACQQNDPTSADLRQRARSEPPCHVESGPLLPRPFCDPPARDNRPGRPAVSAFRDVHRIIRCNACVRLSLTPVSGAGSSRAQATVTTSTPPRCACPGAAPGSGRAAGRPAAGTCVLVGRP